MKKFIVGNWKMNLGFNDSVKLARAFAKGGIPLSSKVVVCPGFLSLAAVADILKKGPIKLGAQDCSVYLPSAHTGDTAASHIKSLGATYVILGHSERRATGESDALVGAKAAVAVSAGLTPIICIGESEAENQAKRTRAVIKRQLSALAGLEIKNIIIAYEPIWAIGSGKTPSPAEISVIHSYIKSIAYDLTGKQVAVIYGGSVNESNAGSFLAEKEISGLLVGGASLKATSFLSICRQS
jgi:triosephosphate isomerase